MRSKMLVILTIVSVLALSLSACGEEVVITATPEPVGPVTFNQMVAEAMAEVPGISPEEAHRRMEEDPMTLVIDPRDAADILATTGIIPGAMNISYGALTWRADNELPQEWREPELEDRSRPIIMACESGELGALAAKLLLDMGFTNVSNLEGGTLAWIDAGYPTHNPEPTGAVTFSQMVDEAMAEVPGISPEEAHRQMEEDPRTLVIDPRDAADILATTGIIPGAMNISYGALTWRADNELPQEWREPELEDRSRPIIMVCESGELGALAAKLLLDMGFTNVSNLEGGTLAWIDAGYPTE